MRYKIRGYKIPRYEIPRYQVPKWLLRCGNRVLLCFMVLCIASCGLFGPTYTKPQVAVPKKWNSRDDLAKMNTSVNLPDVAWWKKFHDQDLNYLIAMALKNNNNIQMAIGNIIQAQGNLKQVEMNWIPSIGGTLGYNSVTSVVSNQPLVGNTNTTSNGSTGYDMGFVPNYSLNIFQQIKSVEYAKANLEVALNAKNAVRLTIISQVAAGYFTLMAADYQLKLQHQLVNDAESQLQLGTDQYQGGYISQLTLQQYAQQYYNAKAQIPIIQNNIVQAKNALRVLINKNPGDIKFTQNFETIKNEGIIPANLPSQVLHNRPDIKQAEAQLKAANANIGVATSNFFPTLSLTGELGTAAAGLSTLFNSGSPYWQNQLNATMPFLNLSYLGQIKGAKGAYYNAYYNYILTVESAFAQVSNGLSAHQKLTESYKTQKMVFDSASIAANLGDIRFKQGADSYVTDLGYKITLDNAALQLAQIKLQQLQSIVTLYQVLAGGYNVKNTEDAHKFGDSHDA